MGRVFEAHPTRRCCVAVKKAKRLSIVAEPQHFADKRREAGGVGQFKKHRRLIGQGRRIRVAVERRRFQPMRDIPAFRGHARHRFDADLLEHGGERPRRIRGWSDPEPTERIATKLCRR